MMGGFRSPARAAPSDAFRAPRCNARPRWLFRLRDRRAKHAIHFHQISRESKRVGRGTRLIRGLVRTKITSDALASTGGVGKKGGAIQMSIIRSSALVGSAIVAAFALSACDSVMTGPAPKMH